jgi:hypothetical protein
MPFLGKVMAMQIRKVILSVATIVIACGLAPGWKAHAEVLTVTIPAHTEWCSKSNLDKELFQNPVGLDKAISTAAAPILTAAQKAKAKAMGAVYARPFAFRDGEIELTDGKITAVVCANVDSSLQTDDQAVTVENVAAVEVLAEVCADADQCVSDIKALLQGEPYRLTDDQIDQLTWRHVNSAVSANTVKTVIDAFNDVDSTPLVATDSVAPDDAQFSVVAVPKPTVSNAPAQPADSNAPAPR